MRCLHGVPLSMGSREVLGCKPACRAWAPVGASMRPIKKSREAACATGGAHCIAI